jgi:hypothetical protein
VAFYFKVIPEADVALQTRARSRAMLDFCQKKLGLSGIRIEWVRKAEEAEFKFDSMLAELETALKRALSSCSDTKTPYGKWKEEFWGQARAIGSIERDKIKIRADIPEWGILQTIAHECQHIRDNLDDYSIWNDWEKHADNFAFDAMREFSRGDAAR